MKKTILFLILLVVCSGGMYEGRYRKTVWGPNLVTNGSFTTNTDGWTETDCTIDRTTTSWEVSGGTPSGQNCLRMSVNADAGTAKWSIPTLVAGKTYQVNLYIAKTTGWIFDDSEIILYLGGDYFYTSSSVHEDIAADDAVAVSGEFVAGDSDTDLTLYLYIGSGAITAEFDNISIKEIKTRKGGIYKGRY